MPKLHLPVPTVTTPALLLSMASLLVVVRCKRRSAKDATSSAAALLARAPAISVKRPKPTQD